MCATCGCTPHQHADDERQLEINLHGHSHSTIALEKAVLEKNALLAARNRHWLTEQGIVALNLVSSPGAGKTTLLERTIEAIRDEYPLGVIEGDQQTSLDAERIRACGCPAIQVNTGAGCHLDAAMVARSLKQLNPSPGSLLLIENVGNLVCPALFDLGEHVRVVIASVTEGEDKPLKYPHMFRTAQLVLINKIDLLPFVRFDLDRFRDSLHLVCPSAQTMLVSAQTGDGMTEWLLWISNQFSQAPVGLPISRELLTT